MTSGGMAGFGGAGYSKPQTRALSTIANTPDPDTSSQEKLVRLLQQHSSQIRFLAGNQKQLQQGVNDATANPVQQVQQFIADVIVLLGGGQLAEGLLDFGDLQYFLPALGALFGFDADSPFPISLFDAAEKFFFGYVVPNAQFADVINRIIEEWAKVFGIDPEFIHDVKALITAFGDLFDGLQNLLPSLNELFGALGITGADLGPLGQVLAPIIKLFSGIDLAKFGSMIEFITDAIDPFIVQLTAIINFINSVLAVLGYDGGSVVNSPLGDTTLPFVNLLSFLGDVNFASPTFDPIAAATTFITTVLQPTGLLATITSIVKALTGIDGGDLGDLTSWSGSLGSNVAKIINALQGINLDDPGSVLGAIEATTEAFAQALVALLGNVPFLGTWLQTLGGTLLDAIDAALAAIRTATGTQQIISNPGAQNSWGGLIPGFWTFPLGSARDTDLLTVNSTTSFGGFITPGESSPVAGMVTALKKTGTVATANMDLYKLATTGPNAGLLTWLWSSDDFAAAIATGSDPALLQMDFPADFALITGPTDVFLAVLRMTGAGSISAVGYGTNNVAAPSGYFPTKPGLTRNPTGTPAPATISAASMASLYSNQRPFMQLARYAQSTDPGGGPVVPPAALMKFADPFNRNPSSNPIRLGSDWTSEKHSTDVAWSPVEGYLSIVNNALIFGPKEFGGYGIGRQGGLYKYAAGSNSHRVGGLIKPNVGQSLTNVPSGLVMCAAADWSRWIGVFTTATSVQIRVGTSFDAYTTVKDIPVSWPANTSVWVWLGYDELTNTFTAYSGVDGTTVLGSWPDTGHLVIHDSAHRFGGAYMQIIGGTAGSSIDEFRLEDLMAGTPDGTVVTPPPAAVPVINRFIDFQNKPDGAFPDPAWKMGRVGAGSAPMTVKNGAGVMLSSGTQSAACYANVALTDNAPIVWAIGGYKFADNNTQAVCAMVWWTYPFPEGLSAILDEVSPMHLVEYPNGYVLQVVATAAPGGPVFNIGGRIYPVVPAAGTAHQIQVTFEAPGKPANTITIIGADGHSDDYTDASLGAADGIEGCMEILDPNPASDREEAVWLYGGFDSVIGGRVPAVSPFVAVTKKAVMAATGAVNGAGQFIVITQKAVMSALGSQTQVGVMTAIARPAVMDSAQAIAISGTASMVAKPAVMSAAGSQSFDGVLSATAKAAVMAAIAAHGTSGTMAATTQKAVMAAAAAAGPVGTMAATTQKAVMSATGIHGPTGTMAATAKAAVMAATGAITGGGASFSDTFNRADGAIGNGWTNQMAVLLRILSNIATPDFVSNYGVALSPTVMNTAKHYAEITINTVNAADAYLIYVGSKTGAQVIAFIQPNSSIQVFTKTSAYSSLVGLTNVGTASSSAAANGDAFRFEFDNGVVTLKRNGSALTGLTSLNVSAVTSTNGRDILIGANVGASARGIDSFASADF